MLCFFVKLLTSSPQRIPTSERRTYRLVESALTWAEDCLHGQTRGVQLEMVTSRVHQGLLLHEYCSISSSKTCVLGQNAAP